MYKNVLFFVCIRLSEVAKYMFEMSPFLDLLGREIRKVFGLRKYNTLVTCVTGYIKLSLLRDCNFIDFQTSRKFHLITR